MDSIKTCDIEILEKPRASLRGVLQQLEELPILSDTTVQRMNGEQNALVTV